jgi:hypothetical protein
MKKTDRKYFLAFIMFVSFLSPACNHTKQQDVRSAYQQYLIKHMVSKSEKAIGVR